MRLRWPPPPLGLGTPFNLAALSATGRSLMRRDGWLVPVLALAVTLAMLGLDRLWFGGASLERVREVGAQPLALRLLVLPWSAPLEEAVYRLGVATLVAWIAYLPLAERAPRAREIAQWLGIAAAAVLFGLAHVGNLPQVEHPVARAVTVNGVAGLVLGWLYFWRGLELAVLTHLVAILLVYVALPPLL